MSDLDLDDLFDHMDVIFSLVFVIFMAILITIICRCCKRFNRQSTLSYVTTVPVTAVPPPVVHNTTAPYPVHPTMMPQPMTYDRAVPVGVAPMINQPPYPVQPGMQGYPPSNMPYPPQNMGGSVQQNPPSYAEATGMYARQAAYNPDFK